MVPEEEYIAYLTALKANPNNVGEVTAPEYPNVVPSVPAVDGEHK